MKNINWTSTAWAFLILPNDDQVAWEDAFPSLSTWGPHFTIWFVAGASTTNTDSCEVSNFHWGSEHNQNRIHQSLHRQLAAFLSKKSRDIVIQTVFNLFRPESLVSQGILQLPLEWLNLPHAVRNLPYLQNF